MTAVLVALYLACTTAGPCQLGEVVIDSGDLRECRAVLAKVRGFKIGCTWRERGRA